MWFLREAYRLERATGGKGGGGRRLVNQSVSYDAILVLALCCELFPRCR